MAVSAGPAVPPRSVFSFRVRCGFRRSLVLGSWLLLTVCGPSRRRPFRVEQSRREPGCRPVRLRRNGATFARSRPFSRGSRHPLAGSRPAASTGRPQGHPVRRLVLGDGVWRTRVGARPRQRRRRRLTGPGPPVWRPSSSGMRLGAVFCSSHVRSGCWRRQSGHRVSEDGAVGRRFQQRVPIPGRARDRASGVTGQFRNRTA